MPIFTPPVVVPPIDLEELVPELPERAELPELPEMDVPAISEMLEDEREGPFVVLVLVPTEAQDAFAARAALQAKEQSPVEFVGVEIPPSTPDADFSPFG
jgi:hypothetical protein